ncbi:MAG: hypothetical protein ACI9W2_004489 [Gammaproteobacteria bacterium]
MANRSTLTLVVHGSDLMYHSPPLQSVLPADLSETGSLVRTAAHATLGWVKITGR